MMQYFKTPVGCPARVRDLTSILPAKGTFQMSELAEWPDWPFWTFSENIHKNMNTT